MHATRRVSFRCVAFVWVEWAIWFVGCNIRVEDMWYGSKWITSCSVPRNCWFIVAKGDPGVLQTPNHYLLRPVPRTTHSTSGRMSYVNVIFDSYHYWPVKNDGCNWKRNQINHLRVNMKNESVCFQSQFTLNYFNRVCVCVCVWFEICVSKWMFCKRNKIIRLGFFWCGLKFALIWSEWPMNRMINPTSKSNAIVGISQLNLFFGLTAIPWANRYFFNGSFPFEGSTSIVAQLRLLIHIYYMYTVRKRLKCWL